MWNSIAELHAAVNDFPPALFVASVVFYLAARFTKRESLAVAGYWSLIGAAVGAVLALVTGLRAEDVIEHGSVMHRSIERHETLAIGFTILVVGLALWRTVRQHTLGARERAALAVVTGIGLIGVVWVGKVGGRIVFQHAGGIQTSVLQAAIAERTAGHEHAPGEGDHEHPPATAAGIKGGEQPGGDTAEDEHEHPPGTPAHEHGAVDDSTGGNDGSNPRD